MVTDRPSRTSRLRMQFDALDLAVYRAVAETRTPDLDRAFGALSRAADHSKLWIGTAGLLALTGPQGRRAAVSGLVAVGVASAVVNLVAKPIGGRRRPDRDTYDLAPGRAVPMPTSTSFPSGHAGSAFAFASGVGEVLPGARLPLELAAAAVAYSRVHTGVHYLGDVIAGAVIGGSIAPVTSAALRRCRPPRE